MFLQRIGSRLINTAVIKWCEIQEESVVIHFGSSSMTLTLTDKEEVAEFLRVASPQGFADGFASMMQQSAKIGADYVMNKRTEEKPKTVLLRTSNVMQGNPLIPLIVDLYADDKTALFAAQLIEERVEYTDLSVYFSALDRLSLAEHPLFCGDGEHGAKARQWLSTVLTILGEYVDDDTAALDEVRPSAHRKVLSNARILARSLKQMFFDNISEDTAILHLEYLNVWDEPIDSAGNLYEMLLNLPTMQQHHTWRGWFDGVTERLRKIRNKHDHPILW